MAHTVKLSNGQSIRIEEGDDSISIVLGACDNGIDGYICEITGWGVLTYPDSGSATSCLTAGLVKSNPDVVVGSPHDVFTRLWSACVDKPGYRKQVWQQVEQQLQQAGVL